MSLFSKSPKDAPPKPDPQAAKPPAPAASRTAVQQRPAPPPAHAPEPAAAKPAAQPLPAPAPAPRGQPAADGAVAPARARPAMPPIAIGPPPAPAAVPQPMPIIGIGPGSDRVVAATRTANAPSPQAPITAKGAPLPEPAKPARVEPMPPGSVRPTAPNMSEAEGAKVSIADTFERLLSLEDLDEGFATIQRAGTGASHSVGLTDLAEVRALFAQLAVNHVRQVRDFMIDLRWRDATVDWIGVCEPALRSLRRAADKLELPQLCGALDRFSEAMTAAQAGGGRSIDGERRDVLLARYEELGTLMPQAFALDLDRTQREAVILQSLLLQLPDVKKVTLDKLYAAGLTTLEAMSLATPSDVAATTGIGEALAARILARFREYRDAVKAAAPDATRTRERQSIAALTAKLRREHDDYEHAAESWAPGAEEKKKELRKARAQTLLDIQVVLARLGEVDRLKEIERLPFERKVTHLESFLEEAREKYVAQS